MKREIITDPNPILREPATPVESFDMQLQSLIDDMVETMRENNGVGLAAPQIGLNKQIVALELDAEPGAENEVSYEPFPLTVLCNPQITHLSKTKCKMVEGCLSFPGMEIVVDRPKELTVKAQDRYGQPIEITADKFFGRVMQHELDHLNSTLLIDHLKEIKLVFFAGGDFALKAIEYLHRDRQYQIAAIVTTPQVGKTRGKTVDKNPVKALAKKLKLNVIEIENLKDAENVEKIKKLKADIGVVADFGIIIPQQVIDIFKYKIVNIHPSILPKYRGPSPIQQTILNGDRFAGMTLMQINDKMDAGPIISQYKVKLRGKETTKMLKEYLADLGATILLDTLPYYISSEMKPKDQKENRVSYTKILKKSDGEVRVDDDPIVVERKVRALNPWPGVYTHLGDLRVAITAAHLDKEKKLVIDRVKPAGKNEMSYEEFRNGYKKELTFGTNIDKISAN